MCCENMSDTLESISSKILQMDGEPKLEYWDQFSTISPPCMQMQPSLELCITQNPTINDVRMGYRLKE